MRLVFSGDLLSSSLFSSIVSIRTFSTDLASFLSFSLISSSLTFILFSDRPRAGFFILKLFFIGEDSDFCFWTFSSV